MKKPEINFSDRLTRINADFIEFNFCNNWRKSVLSAFMCVLFLFFASNFFAQDLPNEIRGYKVYKARIVVKTDREKPENPKEKDKNEAFVKINDPEFADISLTGITFELAAELSSIEQSGTVDFMTFNDFRVNGLKVEVEEYKDSFDFKKNEPIILPKPFKIFLRADQALSGAFKEFKNSKDEWRVTGRVFVFGQFKKSFLKFKRVIPVEIDISIKNPIKEIAAKQKTDTKN